MHQKYAAQEESQISEEQLEKAKDDFENSFEKQHEVLPQPEHEKNEPQTQRKKRAKPAAQQDNQFDKREFWVAQRPFACKIVSRKMGSDRLCAAGSEPSEPQIKREKGRYLEKK